MDDTKKKEKERDIDQLAVKWYAAKVNQEEAVEMKLKHVIWEEMYKIYVPVERLENTMGQSFDERWIAHSDTFMDTIEEVFGKYRPDAENSSFTHYFSRIYMFRKKDVRSDKWKEQKKLVSMDQEKAEDVNRPGGNTQKQYEDKSIGDPSESMIFSENLEDFIALIFKFSDNHKGKANNSRKKLWYHLFYTEDITVFAKCLYKEQSRVSKYIHKRDIFEAMLSDYLDFYMSDKCKNLEDVAYTKLKCYEEIIPDALPNQIGKEIPSEREIPAKVSIQYFAVHEKEKVSVSARSNQKKDYDAEKKALWQ